LKTIIVNTVYKEGSTGKLSYLLKKELEKRGDEVIICYGNGKRYNEKKCIKLHNVLEQKVASFLSKLTGLTGYFSLLSTIKVIQAIKYFNPDIVILGNLHGYYINEFLLYFYLKKRKQVTMQIMWDEYSMTGKCPFSYNCYKYKNVCKNCEQIKAYPKSWFFDRSKKLMKSKYNAYKNFDNIVFVGAPYTITRAKESFLLMDKKLIEIDEGVDLENVFYPKNVDDLRIKYNILKGNIVILNVCIFSNKRKGAIYYLEAARKLEMHENITFIHIGFDDKNIKCPKKFIPIGYIEDQLELSKFYSLADLFVCTSLAETQPNTCLEALGCGTPILGFNISGIPTCADDSCGKFVKACDVEELCKVIKNTKTKNKNIEKRCRDYALKRFSNGDYNRKLIEIAIKEISDKKQ